MVRRYLQCLISVDDSTKEKPFAKLEVKKTKVEKLISDYDTTDTTKSRWKDKQIVPLDVLLEDNIDSSLLESIQHITDFRGGGVFKLPEKPVSPQLSYLVGLAAGDGGFSNDNVWTLVDGGKDDELDYSKRFLESVSDNIEAYFKVNTGLRKRKNRFELYVSNKWFCRFLRNFYGLPRSYKKGKLSRPEIFNSKDVLESFWRGVFDADGAVPNKSNRISLSSATENFLEECREDFDKLGIGVYEIRKPAAYLLRLKPNQLPTFARKVGFSHPRKRELLVEKLEKGSRSYVYTGKTENYIGDIYDLTKIEKLSVIGAEDKIKKYRDEQGLYQRELAAQLGVSKNQIYGWENGEYATPISVLETLFDSKEDLLNYLQDSDNKFKYGKRGNENSLVTLPKRNTQEIDEIAQKSIATSNELRIKPGNHELVDKIEEIFSVKVREKKNKQVVDNLTVYNFFLKYYEYSKNFEAWNEQEIEELKSKLEI